MNAVGPRALAWSAVLALIVAGCGDAGPSSQPPTLATPARTTAAATEAVSPAAGATAAPSPTATPATPAEVAPYRSSMAFGDVLFTPDGRLLVVEQAFESNESQVTLLDAAGRPVPGWPWRADVPHDAVAAAALGPDDSFWVAVRAADHKAGPSWWLYRLDADGQVVEGFPIGILAGSFCGLQAARDGDLVVGCEDESEEGSPAGTTIDRFRPDGSRPSGWPVRLAGSATLYGERGDGAVLVVYGQGSPWQLTMLDPAGQPVAGWPRSVPGERISASIDERDHVWVTTSYWEEDACAPAIRTLYRLLGPDGARLPGWPVTLSGWASDPLPRDDGGGVVVTETGRAIAWAPDGTPADGWTNPKVPVSYGCGDGSYPVAAGQGQTLVTGSDHATLLTDRGRVASDWPIELPGTLAIVCPGCTPGSDLPIAPAVGTDAFYIPVYGEADQGPAVVALSRSGAPLAGWQQRPANPGDEILWIRIAPTGRVWLAVQQEERDGGALTGVLVPVADDRPLHSGTEGP